RSWVVTKPPRLSSRRIRSASAARSSTISARSGVGRAAIRLGTIYYTDGHALASRPRRTNLCAHAAPLGPRGGGRDVGVQRLGLAARPAVAEARARHDPFASTAPPAGRHARYAAGATRVAPR